MAERERLDQALVARGLAPSRQRAQSLIAAGLVQVDGKTATKASQKVSQTDRIELTGEDHPWVSRGGMKLAHGLEAFAVSALGKVCLDLGASTGGFTDVLLQGGASRVYAVDVGHDQLHDKIRSDKRVVNLEGVNARTLDGTQVPEAIDLVTCDASFISLKLVLPPALSMVKPGGGVIALIKPQFEAGRGQIGKGGVVRDSAVHDRVRKEIADWIDGLQDWSVKGSAPSPIDGPDGNREFLIHAVRKAPH
ncbi:MAG: TlyA family RNA methyltransferase [Magnetovibrionaceae bacterium]